MTYENFKTEAEARAFVATFKTRKCTPAFYHDHNPVIMWPGVAEKLNKGDGTMYVVRVPDGAKRLVTA